MMTPKARSMRARAARVAVLAVFSALFCATAVGQNRNDEALELLDRAVNEEPNLSPGTKDAFRRYIAMVRADRAAVEERAHSAAKAEIEKSEAITKMIDEYAQANNFVAKKSAIEKVFGHLKIYGDFRFRHESNFDLDDQPDRHRQRVRFRLGGNLAIDDEITVGFRVVTGDPGDPNSPHQTLGNTFHKFEFNLDRVFLTYAPKWAEGAYLTAGKFANPIYMNPVYGENVWDEDVQPEGAVIGYKWKGDGFVEKFEAVGGLYDVLEVGTSTAGGGEDAYAFIIQAMAQFGLADNFDANLAVGYYDWGDLTPGRTTTVISGDNPSGLTGSAIGNTLVDRDGNGTNDDYAGDFSILNPILALTYSGWDHPITLSGEFIWNLDTDTSEDIGYAVGLSVGQTKKAGDWRFYYNFQEVERDAVFAAVSQDDFLLQTNHMSHLFGGQYQVTDNVGLHLWFLLSEIVQEGTTATTDEDDLQWRVRFDVNIRF